MAKDVHSQPWIFDATTQGEGLGPSLDGVSVVFSHPIFVDRIKVYTGSGGDLLIRSRKETGIAVDGTKNRERIDVVRLQNMGAQDNVEIPLKKRFDGVYMTTLGTSGDMLVYVYHGEE